MRKTSRARIAVAVLLVLVGAGVALYPTVGHARYRWHQEILPSIKANAEGIETAGGVELPEGFVARIEIPVIDLSTYVVEGTDGGDLKKGPGHFEETPMPGETGNCCIAGHRTTYGGPFRQLDDLRTGDDIVVTTDAEAATYRVVSVRRVDPADVSVVRQTDDTRLTLTTCHPEGSARERLVVVAEYVK